MDGDGNLVKITSAQFEIYRADFGRFVSASGLVEGDSLRGLAEFQLEREVADSEFSEWLLGADLNGDSKLDLDEYVTTILGCGWVVAKEDGGLEWNPKYQDIRERVGQNGKVRNLPGNVSTDQHIKDAIMREVEKNPNKNPFYPTIDALVQQPEALKAMEERERIAKEEAAKALKASEEREALHAKLRDEGSKLDETSVNGKQIKIGRTSGTGDGRGPDYLQELFVRFQPGGVCEGVSHIDVSSWGGKPARDETEVLKVGKWKVVPNPEGGKWISVEWKSEWESMGIRQDKNENYLPEDQLPFLPTGMYRRITYQLV